MDHITFRDFIKNFKVPPVCPWLLSQKLNADGHERWCR